VGGWGAFLRLAELLKQFLKALHQACVSFDVLSGKEIDFVFTERVLIQVTETLRVGLLV
jgi:hypothetical protein